MISGVELLEQRAEGLMLGIPDKLLIMLKITETAVHRGWESYLQC
jgi:hypothetical protein